MKKKLSSVLLLLSAIGTTIADHNCSCKATSQTFFTVRPQFQIGSPEYESLARNRRTARECGIDGAFQGVVFGGKSTNKAHLGTFFAPYCSNEIPVDGTIAINSKNVLPQNFNIFSIEFSPFISSFLSIPTLPLPAFESLVTLNPQQSVVGFGFSWQQERYLGEHWFWYGISAPVLHVRNTMGLQEIVTNTALYEVQPIAGETTNLNQNLKNMTEALVQSDWNYGKIDNKIHKTTKLAFIQLQVGMKWASNECYYFEPFIGATFPTGNKVKSEYVFEAIAGNGGHFGTLWGGNGGYVLWQNCNNDLQLSLENTLVMQYLFKTREKRSFDLKYKPWSRYIELYENQAQATQALNLANTNLLQSIFLSSPGINTLTQDASVKPGFNFTNNMAIVLKGSPACNGFEAEWGYNFFARQAECVSLKKRFGSEAAIKDSTGMGITNPVRNITADLLLNEASIANLILTTPFNPQDITNAYGRGIITEDDIDLSSAAHPCVMSHTIYSAFGYHWDNLCYPVFAGFGGSYEFSHTMNTGLDRWLVWGKFGISF